MDARLAMILAAALGCVGGDRYHPAGPGAGSGAGAGRQVAPPDPAERSPAYWAAEARAGIARQLDRRENPHAARNVVMFLGDGMSLPTLAAARTLLGQRRNRTGEETQLFFEDFPTVGLAKTYCLDKQVADSACTATAYLCGVKNNYGTTGVSGAVPRGDCAASADPATHVDSVAAWALADGRDAGIVTTTRITHASPSGAYAHVANRDWESDAGVRAQGHDPQRCPDIAHQLVHHDPGRQFKVILGGGRREFIPITTADEEGTQGRRTDGRNLIEEWQENKRAQGLDYAYVWNREQLMRISDSPPEYLLGLFEGNHMQYNMQADSETEPTLAELTEVAIKSLSRNEKGFFLFVEGGRIDHAHHDNYVELALDETIEFAAAVARAADLLSEDDSLLVVTADHSHVMAFNGYTRRGGDVLGVSDDLDEDGVPYLTLSYTNGPGFRSHRANGVRPDPSAETDFGELEWRAHVDVPLEWETHGGDDIPVFALGPQQHLFTGLYEQSRLPYLMAYAACLGPAPTACEPAAGSAGPHAAPLASLPALAALLCWLRR